MNAENGSGATARADLRRLFGSPDPHRSSLIFRSVPVVLFCRGEGKWRASITGTIKRLKGIWWMPWRQEAMKDVVACEKPRGAGKQAMIRGFPNGETRPPLGGHPTTTRPSLLERRLCITKPI